MTGTERGRLAALATVAVVFPKGALVRKSKGAGAAAVVASTRGRYAMYVAAGLDELGSADYAKFWTDSTCFKVSWPAQRFEVYNKYNVVGVSLRLACL